jgi:tetratricopeptide (TPR) repeat protein
VAAGGAALLAPHGRAWYHFRAGRQALEDYHNPQAVRHLQVCLDVWPDDPDVLLLAARAARRARSYDEAEHFLAKYQEARGCDEAVSFELLLLSAECQVDRVAAVCRGRVERGDPDTPLILEALARGFLRQYRIAEARFCLRRWLRDQPDNPQALAMQAQLRLDYEHAWAEAVKGFSRALELDPDHEEARVGLAVALLESKRFAEAAEQLERLRQLQPDNLRVRVGLAECRDGLGEADEAERLVDEVLAGHPDYPHALALRGRLAQEKGDYAAAETWLRKAVAGNPTDYQARYNLILCLNHNGKAGEAGRQKRHLQQMKDDLTRFDEIIGKELPQRPRDPDLHCTLGRLLLRSGYRDEGLRWLHSALRLDPGHAPTRRALAEYHKSARQR